MIRARTAWLGPVEAIEKRAAELGVWWRHGEVLDTPHLTRRAERGRVVGLDLRAASEGPTVPVTLAYAALWLLSFSYSELLGLPRALAVLQLGKELNVFRSVRPHVWAGLLETAYSLAGPDCAIVFHDWREARAEAPISECPIEPSKIRGGFGELLALELHGELELAHVARHHAPRWVDSPRGKHLRDTWELVTREDLDSR